MAYQVSEDETACLAIHTLVPPPPTTDCVHRIHPRFPTDSVSMEDRQYIIKKEKDASVTSKGVPLTAPRWNACVCETAQVTLKFLP